DAEVAAIPVRINLPDRTATFSGADLGMAVDRDATTEAALAVGKAGDSWDRFVGWLAAVTSVRRGAPVLTFDGEAAAEAPPAAAPPRYWHSTESEPPRPPGPSTAWSWRSRSRPGSSWPRTPP